MTPAGLMDEIVCVDPEDRVVGVTSKLAAHTFPGRLHRAFSVMLVDDAGRLLLQRRALTKYHFAGLWANSCCGHPRPGEDPAAAAARRTFEELGVRPSSLVPCGSFRYEAHDPASGLAERELDHVFLGTYTTPPAPDAAEVAEVRLVTASDLATELQESPPRFAPWLREVLELTTSRGQPASGVGVGRRSSSANASGATGRAK
jgi:isopentenyl-diphosphate Delta-isomerase